MKKTILTGVIGLCAAVVFALTPHINKGAIEEIGLAQAMKELHLSEKELKDVNKEFCGVLELSKSFPDVQEADFNSPVQVFKQTFTETSEILYRVISHTQEPEPFAHGGIFQKGYYSNGTGKPNLIFAEFYDAECTVLGQSVTVVKYNYNFMPIIKNNRIAGIMIYGIERFNKLKSIVENEGFDEVLYHKAAVYWNNDFSTADFRYSYDNRADIYIECSKPLIDENNTFKYTIQNAFDKNPVTSYVEDTEDDLFDIEFIFADEYFFKDYSVVEGKSEIITGIYIINGYAENVNLYNKNNRIKEISITGWNLGDRKKNDSFYEKTVKNFNGILSDGNLSFSTIQIPKVKLNIITFSCSNIYEGTKYKDTCLAEFDIISKNGTNLFGD